MFNLKWSVLSAALGFVLSLLLSLVSGAGIFSLIRALIFGAVFFAVGSLLYWMVKRFLPELLNPEDTDAPGLDIGSRVDISLDDGDDVSALAAAFRQGTGDSLDGALDVEGLERLAGGGELPAGSALDQDGKTDYTDKDIGGGISPADNFEPYVFSSPGIPPEAGFLSESSAGSVRTGGGFPAGEGDAVDALPGPEGMSSGFLPSFGDDFAPGGERGTPVSVAFPGIDRNGMASEEGIREFKGKEKESALAIQTILKRD